MSEELTGQDLKKFFQDFSVNHGKIFLESTMDPQLANNVVTYFNTQRLTVEFAAKCIDWYVGSAKGVAISLSDFIMKLTEIRNTVEAIQKERESFYATLERTRERMEGLE